MRFDKSSVIDDNISTLDQFLMVGFNLYASFLNDWDKRHAVEGYKDEEYAAEKRKSIDDWYQQVIKHLKTYPKQYYVFHFLSPKIPAGLYYHPYSETVSSIKKTFLYRLYALEDILFRLEEQQNLQVRWEIAEREYKQSDLYWTTYDDHTREVRVNNIVLTKTNFDQENDNCMQYIIKNPGEITKEQLEHANGGTLNKELTHIITGLGFVGTLRENFFPAVGKTKLKFVNPISRLYHDEHNLPAIDFQDRRNVKNHEDKNTDKKT